MNTILIFCRKLLCIFRELLNRFISNTAPEEPPLCSKFISCPIHSSGVASIHSPLLKNGAYLRHANLNGHCFYKEVTPPELFLPHYSSIFLQPRLLNTLCFFVAICCKSTREWSRVPSLRSSSGRTAQRWCHEILPPVYKCIFFFWMRLPINFFYHPII